jgi:hypothetical protein
MCPSHLGRGPEGNTIHLHVRTLETDPIEQLVVVLFRDFTVVQCVMSSRKYQFCLKIRISINRSCVQSCSSATTLVCSSAAEIRWQRPVARQMAVATVARRLPCAGGGASTCCARGAARHIFSALLGKFLALGPQCLFPP